MVDVFISYSQTDRHTAKRLAEVLRRESVSISMDEQLAPGADIASSLEQAIRDSQTVLVLLGKTTGSNSWVRTEAAIALSQPDKRVIPVLTTKNADVPFILRHLNAVDLSDEKSFSSNALKLARYLKETPPVSVGDSSARFARVAAESNALRLEQLDYDRAKARNNTSLVAGAATMLGLSIGLAAILIFFKDKLGFSDDLISVLLGVVAGASASYLFGPIRARIRRRLIKRPQGEA